MKVRVISNRSPYRRGGVSFDTAAGRLADGRAVVELDRFEMARIGEVGFRELLTDPNIVIEFPAAVGRHLSDPNTQAGPARLARSPADQGVQRAGRHTQARVSKRARAQAPKSTAAS